MAEFGCIRSFGIDNGELDSVSKQESFVLGYELAQVDARIDAGVDFEMPLVHIENRDRIEAQLVKAGSDALHSGGNAWMWVWRGNPNDESESWLSLAAYRE